MKVYRGPESKPFYDDTHEFVYRISSDQLQEGSLSNSHIRFNITKEAVFRQAVCTAVFEEEDLLPMASALIGRLQASQNALSEIKKVCGATELDDSAKVRAIQATLRQLK